MDMGLPNRRWLEPEYVGGGGEDDGDGVTGGHGTDPSVADLGKETSSWRSPPPGGTRPRPGGRRPARPHLGDAAHPHGSSVEGLQRAQPGQKR